MIACIDGGIFCVPALIAGGVAVCGLLGWATTKAPKAEDCEDHCGHCPGDHEPAE